MACGQQSVYEDYWTICWWFIFPYPCQKTHQVSRWCCTFQWVKEYRWFLWIWNEACSDGTLYRWSGPGLGFGSYTYYDQFMCFGRAMEPAGSCGADFGPSSYGLVAAPLPKRTRKSPRGARARRDG
jgi:hypothetical protein